MEKLHFRLRDIPPDGELSLGLDLDPTLVVESLAGIEGGDAGASIARVDLMVKRERDNVFVRGQLTGLLTVGCVRCLEPARVKVASPVVMTIVPAGSALPDDDSGDEAGTLEDMELSTYEGDSVDLNALTLEQLVLSVPIAPLCSEACKGLCPTCGENRNRATCACASSQHENPFGSLKSLKFE